MNANSLKAARIAIFAALYAALSCIPISVFIGASSLLSLNLIVTPTIAILLSPLEAFLSSLLGSIISLYVAPFQAVFGPYTILLPVSGATLASLGFHKPRTGFFASIYLGVISLTYIIMRPEFPYWVIPHIVGAIIVGGLNFKNPIPDKVKIPLYAFISTICEQATMLIGALFILSLPWTIFAAAFPLMLYERLIGTIGGTLLTYSLYLKCKEYFSSGVHSN